MVGGNDPKPPAGLIDWQGIPWNKEGKRQQLIPIPALQRQQRNVLSSILHGKIPGGAYIGNYLWRKAEHCRSLSLRSV